MPHVPMWLRADWWSESPYSPQVGLVIGGLIGVCIGIACAMHAVEHWYRPQTSQPGEKRQWKWQIRGYELSLTPVTYGRTSQSDPGDDDFFVDCESGAEGSCASVAPSAAPRRRSSTAAVNPPEGSGPKGLKAEVAARFPDAPIEELVRFSKAGSSAAEAIRLYEDYLEWRRGPGSPERLREHASAVHQNFIRHSGVARDGTALLYSQGARYDASVGSTSHALALASMVDTVLATPGAKFSCFLDCRPIKGAPNTAAPKMMPFFKEMTQIILKYPGACQRVVIYPMPWMLKSLWAVLKKGLDEKTRDLVIFVSGSGAMGAECPVDVGKYLSLDQLPADAHDMHASLASQV